MKSSMVIVIGSFLSLINNNNLNAQLKVVGANGRVGIGNLSPLAKLHVTGDGAIFTNASGIPTSSSFIRGTNNYSGPGSPDYTWFGDDQTGIFHPTSWTVGISIFGDPVALFDNSYLSFYHSIYVYGTVNTLSDIRLKKNINKIDGALAKVLKLKGVGYEYKTAEFKSYHLDSLKTLGFIAQELKEIVPEAVRETKEGYYAINYDAIIPLLVEAIKEQNEKIKELEANQVNAGSSVSIKSDELLVKAKLFQNNPNPFNSSTEIKCLVPGDIKKAELFIYDMQGTQIRKIEIAEKGDVILLIKSETLKPGMYIYSLIIDGKEIDTKRMILTN